MKKILILLLLSYSIITSCMNEEYSNNTDLDMEDEWSSDDVEFNDDELFSLGNFDPSKIGALILAVCSRDVDTINSLIEAGVDLEGKNEQGLTVLTTAAKKGFADMVIYLIDKGAKITGKDAFGRTALIHAVLRNDEELVDLLLMLLDGDKKTINAQDKSGKSAVSLAMIKDNKNIADKLISNGAHVDQNNIQKLLLKDQKNLEKAVFGFIADGKLDLVKNALDKGVSPNSIDECCRTLLMWAVKYDQEAIVKLLIEKGADVNKELVRVDTDIYGGNFGTSSVTTALSIALEKNNQKIIDILIESGANTDNYKNNNAFAYLFGKLSKAFV